MSDATRPREEALKNPFDELKLNPRLDVRALTALLQERARHASPEEKARLQAAWRALTQRHADRVRWALLAHPRDGRDVPDLDKLRSQTPPLSQKLVSRNLVSQNLALPPLTPTIEDALVLPRTLSVHDEELTPSFFTPSPEATDDTGGST